MEQAKINRISELTRIVRERGLSEQEKKERETLRSEYLAEWRKGAQAVLDKVVIIDPDGSKHPAKEKK